MKIFWMMWTLAFFSGGLGAAYWLHPPHGPHHPKPIAQAPEIDPGSGGAALAVLVANMLVW
jgi:hypothetical protein